MARAGVIHRSMEKIIRMDASNSRFGHSTDLGAIYKNA
jgi:hypothetical protein